MTQEQLRLPKVDSSLQSAGNYALPTWRRIWVNRSLRMDQIEWVGFDMDYTLAIYKQSEIDRLSIEATVKKLVDRGYPPDLAEVKYAADFPIRGLLIDKRYGHILKMDRYKFVAKAFHGHRELPREERRALYLSQKIKPNAEHYHWVDTLYALPEVALYAGAIDLLERMGAPIDYSQLFRDIRECIDEAHKDGSIINVIQADLPRFVERDLDLPQTLHRLRSTGKKLFLLTNSRWEYTNAMMSYLFDGCMTEYPSWRQYFDIVVVTATKPVFFTGQKPFLEINGGTKKLATKLERGKIYENGNLKDFERLLKINGDTVLYIGDHIFGDILRSKKDSAWRTAMIIQEMTAETAALENGKNHIAEINSMTRRRERLEDELRYRQAKFRAIERELETSTQATNGVPIDEVSLDDHEPEEIDEEKLSSRITLPPPPAEPTEAKEQLQSERMKEKRAIERIRIALRELEDRYQTLVREVDAMFHPFWGSLFKQGVEVSLFGDQVEEYACLYTSRVSNFLAYSPVHFFRSPRDHMPHELPSLA